MIFPNVRLLFPKNDDDSCRVGHVGKVRLQYIYIYTEDFSATDNTKNKNM